MTNAELKQMLAAQFVSQMKLHVGEGKLLMITGVEFDPITRHHILLHVSSKALNRSNHTEKIKIFVNSLMDRHTILLKNVDTDIVYDIAADYLYDNGTLIFEVKRPELQNAKRLLREQRDYHMPSLR